MTSKLAKPAAIPEWYLQVFHAVQNVDGSLRNIEMELSEAMDADALDPRVRAEMLRVIDALHAIKGGLVLVDMTAREALDARLRSGHSRSGPPLGNRVRHLGQVQDKTHFPDRASDRRTDHVA